MKILNYFLLAVGIAGAFFLSQAAKTKSASAAPAVKEIWDRPDGEKGTAAKQVSNAPIQDRWSRPDYAPAPKPMPTDTAERPRCSVDGSDDCLCGCRHGFACTCASSKTSKTAIKWFTSYGPAATESERTGKPMFVDLRLPVCMWCDKLDKGPLSDPTVVAMIAEKFVALRIDCETETYVKNALGVRSCPTTVVAAPDKTILSFRVGYAETATIKGDLAKAFPGRTAIAIPDVQATPLPRSEPPQPVFVPSLVLESPRTSWRIVGGRQPAVACVGKS